MPFSSLHPARFLDASVVERTPVLRMRKDMPVIVSTGFGEESRLADLRAAGARDTLMKPYGTAKLLVTVRDALIAPSP